MATPDGKGFRAAGGRVGWVARQTLREAVRLRLTVLLGLVGLLPAAAGWWLRGFALGPMEPRLLAEFGLGLVTLAGTLLAAAGTAHLFFRDISGGLAALVLTRRLGRGEFLAGKLAGVAALLALWVAVLVAVLGVVLVTRGTNAGAVLLVIQAGALCWLKLTLVAAMTLLVCSYAGSELFAAGAGLWLALAGHLRPFTAAEGVLAWLRLWPNLGLFDAEPLLAGELLPGAGLAGLVAYWAVFLLGFLGLAIHVFRRREF